MNLSLDAMLDWRGQPYDGDYASAYQKSHNNPMCRNANPTNNPRPTVFKESNRCSNVIFLYRYRCGCRRKMARNETPSSWALMTPDESPSSHLWIPEVQLRKVAILLRDRNKSFLYRRFQTRVLMEFGEKFNPLEEIEKGPGSMLNWICRFW